MKRLPGHPSLYFILSFLVSTAPVYPLSGQEASKHLTARFISGQIELDGVLDEPVWASAEPTDSFWQYFPTDSILAQQSIEVRVVYNGQTTWARVPQNQMLSSLAFKGELHFERPLGKSRTPFAIIPYVNALAQKGYEIGLGNEDFKFGGDAKVANGYGMNLDLTVNPGISNVEVDDIFTNLTRFELFLPEKRQFFIDTSDLFESFATSRFALRFRSINLKVT